jgi:formylglycine-generating enzyme required for sulfatase activity
VHDLVGNGWEWTSTEFAPFPGFVAMASYPEYSAEFFDHRHAVLKGASPATAKELVRRSFRNWFRRNYPYVYSKFRTVSSTSPE